MSLDTSICPLTSARYRFAVDVEVYIDSSCYMKGIAKCLFDKLFGLLDPCYAERGGYAIEGEELEGIGLSRVVSDIVLTVPFDRPERIEWKGRFLTQWLGFKKVGTLEDLGNKLGQRSVPMVLSSLLSC